MARDVLCWARLQQDEDKDEDEGSDEDRDKDEDKMDLSKLIKEDEEEEMK